MFSEKYLKENFERSWGKVDSTKLNWDVAKEERGEESTIDPDDYIDTGSGGNDDGSCLNSRETS